MPSVFGCISSGSRYGNGPNELVHRAGPPFLDNHYRGYQYCMCGNFEQYSIPDFAVFLKSTCTLKSVPLVKDIEVEII